MVITVALGLPKGVCIVAAASERDAAVTAEKILLSTAPDAFPVSVWVQCADSRMKERLTRYLVELQDDLAAVAPG